MTRLTVEVEADEQADDKAVMERIHQALNGVKTSEYARITIQFDTETGNGKADEVSAKLDTSESDPDAAHSSPSAAPEPGKPKTTGNGAGSSDTAATAASEGPTKDKWVPREGTRYREVLATMDTHDSFLELTKVHNNMPKPRLGKGTLSSYISKLEGSGYVERRDHPRDGRKYQYKITGKGRGLVGEADKQSA